MRRIFKVNHRTFYKISYFWYTYCLLTVVTLKLNQMKKIIYLTFFLFGALSFSSSAQCVKGNCYNGKGTYAFANGDKYAGQWKDGKMQGKGAYEFTTGDRYNGDFNLNQRQGSGTYVWVNKNRYVGEWKAGKRDGHGVYQWSSSATYNGFWKEDQIIDMDVSTVTDSQERPVPGK